MRLISHGGTLLASVPVASIAGAIWAGLDTRHWVSHAAGIPAAVLLAVALLVVAAMYGRSLGMLRASAVILAIGGALVLSAGDVRVIQEEGRTEVTYDQAHSVEAQSQAWEDAHKLPGRGMVLIGAGLLLILFAKRHEVTAARAVTAILATLPPIGSMIIGLGWAILMIDLARQRAPRP